MSEIYPVDDLGFENNSVVTLCVSDFELLARVG
jgi:hypothetical protein